MSRMTGFLKQKAIYSAVIQGKLDLYGNSVFQDSVVVKCRRERVSKQVQTLSGSLQVMSTVYYVDNTVRVSIGDKLDDRQVIDFSEYIDGSGLVVGYEVMVE